MVWFYTETLRSGGEKSWGYKNLESSFDKLGNYWNIVTISTLNYGRKQFCFLLWNSFDMFIFQNFTFHVISRVLASGDKQSVKGK